MTPLRWKTMVIALDHLGVRYLTEEALSVLANVSRRTARTVLTDLWVRGLVGKTLGSGSAPTMYKALVK